MTRSTFVLATNVWNESEAIPRFFKNIVNQTRPPSLWIWIDDGSTDGTSTVIHQEAEETDIPIRVFTLPPKAKGNMDTIGRAYNRTLIPIRDEIDAGYLSIVDVDTVLPLNYFERMIRIMDTNPQLGACAAQNRGEPREGLPMGGGKTVRWEIVRSIDQFWDLAPDSFLNIKTLSKGYEARIIDEIEINAEPSTILTPKGRFRFGRRSFYVRKHPILVLQMALTLASRKKHGTDFLRGYIQEWTQGTWTCDDADIRYFYSFKYRLNSWLRRFVGISISPW